MSEVMSQGKIKDLWNTPDGDFTKDERLLLYWHKILRHAPKKYIRRLVRRGCLTKRIEKMIKMPLCAACAFAYTTRKKWRNKFTSKKIRKLLDRPGNKTSFDHLISHELGIIPQVTGRLTYQRYSGAIIFSDHHLDFTYTHLIKSTSLEKMLAKRSYERVARAHGVKNIQHYHADNLRFNDKEFKEDCNTYDQTYSYYGVGTNHQNGIV